MFTKLPGSCNLWLDITTITGVGREPARSGLNAWGYGGGPSPAYDILVHTKAGQSHPVHFIWTQDPTVIDTYVAELLGFITKTQEIARWALYPHFLPGHRVKIPQRWFKPLYDAPRIETDEPHLLDADRSIFYSDAKSISLATAIPTEEAGYGLILLNDLSLQLEQHGQAFDAPGGTLFRLIPGQEITAQHYGEQTRIRGRFAYLFHREANIAKPIRQVIKEIFAKMEGFAL